MKNKKMDKQKQEIIGALFIVLSIISFLSIINLSMGLIGEAINKFLTSIMGFGSYFFPFLLFLFGLIMIKEKFKNKKLKTISIYITLFIFILILLDSMNLNNLNSFKSHIKNGYLLALEKKGGGFIGSFLGFIFYKLFGKLGTFIISFFAFIISYISIYNKNIKDLLDQSNIINIYNIIGVLIFSVLTYFIMTKFNKVGIILFLLSILFIYIIYKYMKVYRPRNINHKKSSNISSKDKEVNVSKSKEKLSNSNNLKILDYKDSNQKIENKNLKSRNKNNTNTKETSQYVYPPIELLDDPIAIDQTISKKELEDNARKIKETMKNFNIECDITQISKGPTITCYELQPGPSVKLSKIVSLADNIALTLASPDIRIEAPIPGKSAVGIEVPNRIKENVLLKELITSEEFGKINSNIPLVLGKDVSGKAIISSIDKMPHLLIAGATGSGKSVCINTIIMSIIYKSSPEETKLLLIDPKMVELSIYNNIPHLLIPVVTNAQKATKALNWAVKEMEHRYSLFAETNSRDIKGYNKKVKASEKLSNIVIVIDELADLMMVAAKEIEDYITRLAQMARAAGMYLIIATQRPSVDIITGTIKANIPSRISFQVTSQIDSRTILDVSGAEKLLGQGDMLYFPSNFSKPKRIQGAFVSDNEVNRVVEFLKEEENNYDKSVMEKIENMDKEDYNTDPLVEEAIKLVVDYQEASISMLQRELSIGYNRARKIIDSLEKKNIVGKHRGSQAREVLVDEKDLNNLL